MLNTMNCNFEKKNINLMRGGVLIATNLRLKIRETKSVKVGNLYYMVTIEEEDG